MTNLELIDEVLKKYPDTRDDQDLCYCRCLELEGSISPQQSIELYRLLRKKSYESIRRGRQKIQELCKELGPSKRIARIRNDKEQRARNTRGMSVAHEMYTTSTKHDVKF